MLEIYFSWKLIIPAALFIIRGYMSIRTIDALGYHRKCTVLRGSLDILPEMLLFCLWCMMGLNLTAVYVFEFVCYAFRWCPKGKDWSEGFFLASLAQPLFMAFHMIVIGTVAIIVKMPMEHILYQPSWRIVIISIALSVSILADIVIMNWTSLKETLRIQAASEEKWPFMVFLWFCNIFLLLDSQLCISKIDWKLLPLLLIGAAILKEWFIIYSLINLRSIILEHHIEVEHRVLEKELEQQEKRTEELIHRRDRDALTGLFSRQYLMEHMELLLEEKRRFSLAFIDLDGLKRINDSQGHAAGDRYLIQFSRYVIGHLREEDVIARIGGDEFVILLLDCDKTDACDKLEKMRSELTGEQFEYMPTFSFGIAEAGIHTEENVYQILERADKNMYQDKESRRK